MSVTVQGQTTPVLVATYPAYNSETRVRVTRYEYQGTESGIRGMESSIQAQGLSYQVTHDGPVWTMIVEQPELQILEQDIDRWEIFTESVEKSLFDLPTVAEQSKIYDDALAAGADTYREVVEKAVREKTSNAAFQTGVNSQVIRHLRAGVTGWQLDLLVIRRTRRLDRFSATNLYRITLDTGLLLYTTAELGVPNEVAFALPALPSDVSDVYKWRWRKRSQRVEIAGNYADQTIELVLAPWSVLAYSDANQGLAW